MQARPQAALPPPLASVIPPATRFWQRAGIRAALALGAAARPVEAHGQRMDPVMSALLRYVRRLPGAPNSGSGSPGLHALRAFRSQYEKAPGLVGLRPDPSIRVQPVPELPGSLECIPPGPLRGTLLYFHGGGFIMGSPATHDPVCRRLARRTGLRVVNAAYRLAPEHPYPAAHQDAAAAWAWVRANRPGPYVLGGDSAGANLAAGLDAAGVSATMLLYPCVDMVQDDALYPSLDAFGRGFLLTADGMQECARLLVPGGVDRGEPLLSPLRGPLSQAAPSVVMTAAFDPLRDQGRAWAAALHAAGRPAWLLEEPGLVHGFADFAGMVPAARRALDRLADAVAAVLKHGNVPPDAAIPRIRD